MRALLFRRHEPVGENHGSDTIILVLVSPLFLWPGRVGGNPRSWREKFVWEQGTSVGPAGG